MTTAAHRISHLWFTNGVDNSEISRKFAKYGSTPRVYGDTEISNIYIKIIEVKCNWKLFPGKINVQVIISFSIAY